MGGTIEVTRGLAADRRRDVYRRGLALTADTSPFDGSETLAVKVWPGDELATVATPSARWITPSTGTYEINFVAADTSGLDVGFYRFLVTATGGGKTGKIDEGRLRLVAEPDSGALALAFCGLSDLLLYCPWVEDLQDDSEQFAFTTERVRASFRLIDDLVNSWDTRGLSPQIGQPGWNALASGWGSLSASPSKWLYDQLVPLAVGGTVPAEYPNRTVVSANLYDPGVSTALLLKPTVKEQVAKRALSYVFRAQIGRDESRPWQTLAGRFYAESAALFRATRFEVDLADPQTGWASITVNGGAGSLR